MNRKRSPGDRGSGIFRGQACRSCCAVFAVFALLIGISADTVHAQSTAYCHEYAERKAANTGGAVTGALTGAVTGLLPGALLGGIFGGKRGFGRGAGIGAAVGAIGGAVRGGNRQSAEYGHAFDYCMQNLR